MLVNTTCQRLPCLTSFPAPALKKEMRSYEFSSSALGTFQCSKTHQQSAASIQIKKLFQNAVWTENVDGAIQHPFGLSPEGKYLTISILHNCCHPAKPQPENYPPITFRPLVYILCYQFLSLLLPLISIAVFSSLPSLVFPGTFGQVFLNYS